MAGRVLLAGLLLRLAWLAFAQPAPVSDFEYYRRLAVHLVDAHQLGESQPSAVRVPLYSWFLAAATCVSRGVVWLSIVNVLMSTALIPVIARLAGDLTGSRAVAVTAAWIVALNCLRGSRMAALAAARAVADTRAKPSRSPTRDVRQISIAGSCVMCE